MEESLTLKSGNRQLSARLSLPKKPHGGIVIAHSYRNDMNEPLCSYAAQRFQNAGYATLRFDFTGHGDHGKKAGILNDVCYRVIAEDMSAATGYLSEKIHEGTQNGIYFFGVSLGTAAAMLCPARPKAQVLVSPILDQGELLKRYYDQIAASIRRHHGIEGLRRFDGVVLQSLSGRGEFNMGTEWIAEMSSEAISFKDRYKIERVPTLLVNGTRDELADISKTTKVANSNPKIELHLFDSDHNFTDLPSRSALMDVVIPWLNATQTVIRSQ